MERWTQSWIAANGSPDLKEVLFIFTQGYETPKKENEHANQPIQNERQ